MTEKQKAIYAEDVDYWKTGASRSPEQWIALAVKQLEDHGATHVMQAIGQSEAGLPSFLIAFRLAGEQFKVLWPALPVVHRTDANLRAAKVQAATSLYHEVKHCCVVASRYGVRRGFFQYTMLPSGKTIAELAKPELLEAMPQLLLAKAEGRDA